MYLAQLRTVGVTRKAAQRLGLARWPMGSFFHVAYFEDQPYFELLRNVCHWSYSPFINGDLKNCGFTHRFFQPLTKGGDPTSSPHLTINQTLKKQHVIKTFCGGVNAQWIADLH